MFGQAVSGLSQQGETTDQLSGSLTKIKGKHTFKAGAGERIVLLNQSSPGMNTGEFDVCMAGTNQIPSGLTPDGMNWGHSIATFLAGWGGSCALGGGGVGTSLAVATGARDSEMYFADDIRATRNLTLSLGLRYELNWPYSERYNRIGYFDQNVGSTLNPLLAAEGVPLLSGGMVYANADHRHVFGVDAHDFAPRFGLSWQFKPKWVARGGYGYFYSIPSNQVNNFVADGYTSSTNYNWSTSSGATLLSPFDNPFPNGLVPAAGSNMGAAEDLGNFLPGNGYVSYPSYDLTPRVQQWSISIERELPGNAVVEIGYTGSHGYHLADGDSLGLFKAFPVNDMIKYGCLLDSPTCSGKLDNGTVVTGGTVNNPWYTAIHTLAPGSNLDTPTIATYQYLGANPQFSGLNVGPGAPLGKSWYESGFVRYTRHMAKGLQFTAHYTWSKAESNSETANDGNDDSYNCAAGACLQDGNGVQAQDWGNFGLEKSVTLNDITHRIVSDGVYELPWGRGRTFGTQWNRALDAVVGGWRVSGILTLQSGAPIVAHLAGGDLGNPNAGFTQRPNLTGNPVTSGSVESRLGQTGQSLYLNLNSFSAPSPYTFGTAPRIMSNARAEGYRNVDMAMFKEVYFTEGRTKYLQIRAEASNIANHPLFGYPSSIVNGGGFGVISGPANSPRAFFITLKLYF